MVNHKYFRDLGVKAEISHFEAEDADDVHVMLHVEPRGELFDGQYKRLSEVRQSLIDQYGEPTFERWFLSDIINQKDFMHSSLQLPLNSPSTPLQLPFSVIQQPPLDGSKVALWMYFRRKNDSRYQHIWRGSMCERNGSSYDQTKTLLETYEQELREQGISIADNCVRTWFYVRDVDTQYKGMVDARRENFITQRLTEQTHYLSSTGIGGQPLCTEAIVQMDAYAVIGLRPGQQRYLYAKTHLNSTYEYGVTFERGTAVDYDHHTEIFISGTASIDNKGDVLYVGDIVKQTERMLENVSELLKEGGATLADVAQAIVYLRDVADYSIVQPMLAEHLPGVPLVIIYAPVCRPAWLIEMECIAYVK